MPISIIIPAYNEFKKLQLLLDHLIEYSNNTNILEIIVMDDGRIHKTVVASEF